MARARQKSAKQITLELQQAAERSVKARADQRARDKALEFGIDAETMKMPANGAVVVVMESARPKVVQTAKRDPMRDTLRAAPKNETREAKAEAAAITLCRQQTLDRYEIDAREAAGEGYKEGGGEFVDGASWRKSGPTDRRLLAAARLDIAQSLVGKRATAILNLVINPPSGEAWQAGVERLTRETNPMAQSACVRAAVDDLTEAYEAMDGNGKIDHWRKMRCDA